MITIMITSNDHFEARFRCPVAADGILKSIKGFYWGRVTSFNNSSCFEHSYFVAYASHQIRFVSEYFSWYFELWIYICPLTRSCMTFLNIFWLWDFFKPSLTFILHNVKLHRLRILIHRRCIYQWHHTYLH